MFLCLSPVTIAFEFVVGTLRSQDANRTRHLIAILVGNPDAFLWQQLFITPLEYGRSIP